ncbi:MAG: DUF4293 domain-containing protein [Flavipsychrobacter sp.]|nr:DUF4293 domain-containing protein [Flavipsychrobacter sp.]
MIQRIQSLWLLVAALVNAGVFYFPLYRGHVDNAGVDTLMYLEVGQRMPLLLAALVMTILPAVAIFLYGNRKRQKRIVLVSFVAAISFITVGMMYVTRFISESGIANDSYWIGMVLPFISIVFLVLAFMGIRKDEKLVKSLDRLR